MMKNLFLLICLMLFIPRVDTASSSNTVSKEERKEEKALTSIDYRMPSENDLIVYNTVRKQGHTDFMSRMVVIQAHHESATYKSKLFRAGNNAFGMMLHKGDTLALKEPIWAEGRCCYAGYKSLEHSTLAALAWLERKGCPYDFKTVKQYATWLKSKNYYEAPLDLYVNAMEKHLEKLYLPPPDSIPSTFSLTNTF